MWKCKVNSGLEICNFWQWDLVLISEMDQEANVALCNLVPLGLLGIQLFRGVRGKCSLEFICSRGSGTCIVVCQPSLWEMAGTFRSPGSDKLSLLFYTHHHIWNEIFKRQHQKGRDLITKHERMNKKSVHFLSFGVILSLVG